MKKDYQKIINSLKKFNKRKLDDLFHTRHSEVFSTFDCLTCANCCKSIPPRLNDADIRRISKHMRIKPAQFAEKFVAIDDDGDQVINTSPCPFLETDNRCRIYEYRPLACSEYPHTDRPRMYQILDLTAKNTLVCPAIKIILDNIHKSLR